MPFSRAYVDLLDKVNGIQVYNVWRCCLFKPFPISHLSSIWIRLIEGSCLCQLTKVWWQSLPISVSFSTRLLNSFLTSLPFSPHLPSFHFLSQTYPRWSSWAWALAVQLLQEQRDNLIYLPFCLSSLLILFTHRSLHTKTPFSFPTVYCHTHTHTYTQGFN